MNLMKIAENLRKDELEFVQSIDWFLPTSEELLFVECFLGLAHATSVSSIFIERFRTLSNLFEIVNIRFENWDVSEACKFFQLSKNVALFFYNLNIDLLKFNDSEEFLKKYFKYRKTLDCKETYFDLINQNWNSNVQMLIDNKKESIQYLDKLKKALDNLKIQEYGSIDRFQKTLILMCE